MIHVCNGLLILFYSVRSSLNCPFHEIMSPKHQILVVVMHSKKLRYDILEISFGEVSFNIVPTLNAAPNTRHVAQHVIAGLAS